MSERLKTLLSFIGLSLAGWGSSDPFEKFLCDVGRLMLIEHARSLEGGQVKDPDKQDKN